MQGADQGSGAGGLQGEQPGDRQGQRSEEDALVGRAGVPDVAAVSGGGDGRGAGNEADLMAFDIDQEHPEYTARKAALRRYRDLYAGGEQFKANAAEYLIRRQREPGDVYAERLSRVFYENYVGSIVDWYAATLFRREPNITSEGNDPPAEKFLAALIEDADRRETSLSDFFRRQFIESLVAGTSYVLVDFPRVGMKPGTRAEEDSSGASRAYL